MRHGLASGTTRLMLPGRVRSARKRQGADPVRKLRHVRWLQDRQVVARSGPRRHAQVFAAQGQRWTAQLEQFDQVQQGIEVGISVTEAGVRPWARSWSAISKAIQPPNEWPRR
jgi:hypothetical protein